MRELSPIEVAFDGFVITTDRSKMDVVAIHEFLSTQSGWSLGISLERV